MRAEQNGTEAMLQTFLVEADIQATTGGRGLENAHLEALRRIERADSAIRSLIGEPEMPPPSSLSVED